MFLSGSKVFPADGINKELFSYSCTENHEEKIATRVLQKNQKYHSESELSQLQTAYQCPIFRGGGHGELQQVRA